MNNKERAALLALVLSMPLILSYLIAPALKQPGLLFLKTWGGDYADYGRHVAVDSFGNVYVSGLTSSFGVDHGSASSPVLLKYNSMGFLLWQRLWSEPNSDFSDALGLAVDSGLNIYLTGETRPPLLSPLTTPTAFLLKLNSTGSLRWQKAWDAAGSQPVGSAVAVDASGNIYVAGQIEGYGGITTVSLLKFNSTGGLLWARNWGPTGFDFASSVAVDIFGNVSLVGSTRDAGRTDILLLQFDSTGTLTRETAWGGSTDVAAKHVVVDDARNIYVTGCMRDAGSPRSTGVLLAFQYTGYPLWQKQWTSGGDDCSHSDSVDHHGNVYVAGDTSAGGVYNAFLLKFNSPNGNLESQKVLFETNSKYAGSLSWTQPSRGNDTDTVNDLAIDPSGNLFVIGSVAESPHFTLGVGNYNVTRSSIQRRDLNSTASTPTWKSYDATGVPINITGSESYSGSDDLFILKFGESAAIYIDTALVLSVIIAIPILLIKRQMSG